MNVEDEVMRVWERETDALYINLMWCSVILAQFLQRTRP